MEKYKLSSHDWKLLQEYHAILQVKYLLSSYNLRYSIIFLKLPYAFQQYLSSERLPTLCHTVVAFHSLRTQWEKYQNKHPQFSHIIQAGVDKLENYLTKIHDVPAYVIALSKYIF